MMDSPGILAGSAWTRLWRQIHSMFFLFGASHGKLKIRVQSLSCIAVSLRFSHISCTGWWSRVATHSGPLSTACKKDLTLFPPNAPFEFFPARMQPTEPSADWSWPAKCTTLSKMLSEKLSNNFLGILGGELACCAFAFADSILHEILKKLGLAHELLMFPGFKAEEIWVRCCQTGKGSQVRTGFRNTSDKIIFLLKFCKKFYASTQF
jgi:hypothetical protein